MPVYLNRDPISTPTEEVIPTERRLVSAAEAERLEAKRVAWDRKARARRSLTNWGLIELPRKRRNSPSAGFGLSLDAKNAKWLGVADGLEELEAVKIEDGVTLKAFSEKASLFKGLKHVSIEELKVNEGNFDEIEKTVQELQDRGIKIKIEQATLEMDVSLGLKVEREQSCLAGYVTKVSIKDLETLALLIANGHLFGTLRTVDLSSITVDEHNKGEVYSLLEKLGSLQSIYFSDLRLGNIRRDFQLPEGLQNLGILSFGDISYGATVETPKTMDCLYFLRFGEINIKAVFEGPEIMPDLRYLEIGALWDDESIYIEEKRMPGLLRFKIENKVMKPYWNNS